MKYKGMELKEFTSDKPVVFDPPKFMFVWDHSVCTDNAVQVCAYIPGRANSVISMGSTWTHCAEIPKERESRIANHRELAKWLAQGNGEWKANNGNFPRRRAYFDYTDDLATVLNVLIRKWEDDEWHEPTVDYMGLED